jgi:hypothetical protein
MVTKPADPRHEMTADAAPSSTTAAATGFRSPAPWSVLLVLGALALYWRAPLLGFAGDDALVLYHLKRLGGILQPAAYFTALDFFNYYRPLGFLAFAADAALWSFRPAGFHVTNVVLHAVNGLLVFALARRVLTVRAAALAAALFIAHASNQEAVYWISARFDLLATLFVLTTVLLATRERAVWVGASLVAFSLALLSKEAALAAPIIVGAYEVFVRKARTGRVVVVLTLMLAVIAGYAVVRSAVAGLDPTGGASRLPKAVLLVAGVGALIALSHFGWKRWLDWMPTVRLAPAVIAVVLLIAAVVAVSLQPVVGAPLRQKLSFAGFASFYLFSPVVAPAPPPFFIDPTTPVYWAGGLAAVLAVAGLLVFARRCVAGDGVWLFLIVATAGTLLPVSSLTEGQRYLYMGSVGVSLGLAKWCTDCTGRLRRSVAGVVALLLAVSVWQVQLKGSDWAWATGMLSRGAALVNADLPGCDQGDVVFAVAPVGVRGVYSHFYHQTFSQDGGCEPGSYRALVRAVRSDQAIDVRWEEPRTLVIRAPRYARNFVLSQDLRAFAIEQRSVRHARLQTPLGVLVSRPDGDAQDVRLVLAPEADLGRLRFYYFAEGEVRRVPPIPASWLTPR